MRPVVVFLAVLLLAACDRTAVRSEVPSAHDAEATSPRQPSPPEHAEPKGYTPGGPVPQGVPEAVPGRASSTDAKTGVDPEEEYRTAAKRPLAAVMANAMYAPQLDAAALLETTTGQTTKRPGETKVGFCVGPDGKTKHIRTTKDFPGDPEVDEIARKTVETWRFRPFVVAGEVTVTCTTKVFRISFD